MFSTHPPHRKRGPGRLLARAATVGTLTITGMGGLVGIAAVALAHHPEISASTECGGTVHFTASAWVTSSDAARTNPKIGVSYSTNGGSSFTSLPQLDAYRFDTDNGFSFSDTLNLTALTGSLPSSVVIKATALASWGNGGGGGSSRQTGVLTVSGCPAQPAATISAVDCSANGAASIKLTNRGDDDAVFTITGPDGTSSETVAGHGSKTATRTVDEDADATFTVAAAGMDTVTKTVHRNCTEPAPIVTFGHSDVCTIDVTFSNKQGTQGAVFTATNSAGETSQVTVPAGEETTRSHIVAAGTSDTITVTSPGMPSATHTLACAAVVPPVDEPPVDEPPVDEPPVDEPPVDEPPVDEPPVDEPSAVLGTVRSTNAQRMLPVTGSDTAELLIAGLLALATGAALTTAGRRRGDAH